ncbi:Nudix (Nucleoside diphosphate linked moiety X)-type motif 1 [Coemansia erecta]|nr:Nudix (Nucleoside diphosphate linked moiety X)-type motif 1 [Coemansia erecta]
MQPLYTVIFPLEDDKDVSQVLLGLKKRGMGEGLWNGFGGKLEPNETIDACAYLLFMKCRSGWEITIFVYVARGLVGDLCESDEMRPQWFGVDELPYEKAHTEARLWWPTMLAGHTFSARFVFSQDDLVEHSIEHVSRAQLELLQTQVLESHNSVNK